MKGSTTFWPECRISTGSISFRSRLRCARDPARTTNKKYRIYKDIKERDGNGEAYLTSEEENMILSVCRNPEEAELMKSCTYAYRYPTTLVLKSFREDKKK